MYESPIALTAEEIQSILEDEVLKVTKKIGIDVDKDELIKALKYDRGQYEKGYADGKAEQKKGKWIEDEAHSVAICSQCGASSLWKSPYCPYCGAEMEVEQ